LGLVLPVYAQSWKDEFDEICAKVNIAHTLSEKQLTELINRADTLIKKLEKMDMKSKRLYIFRLEKCKKFFQYNLELKRSKTEL
jgi:ribosome-binding protein aMBF1 (putative translation factor)